MGFRDKLSEQTQKLNGCFGRGKQQGDQHEMGQKQNTNSENMNGQQGDKINMLVINQTDKAVELLKVDGQQESCQGVLQANKTLQQSAFTGQLWRLKEQETGNHKGEFRGNSETPTTIVTDNGLRFKNLGDKEELEQEDQVEEKPVAMLVNKSDKTVDVKWLGGDGNELGYGSVGPNDSWGPCDTYVDHIWRFREEGSGDLLGEYKAISKKQLNKITNDGHEVEDLKSYKELCHTEFGAYRKRAEIFGFNIWGFDAVRDESVEMAKRLIHFMFESIPQNMVEELANHHLKVAIIAVDQKTTDIPEHYMNKFSTTNYDGIRGLGANKGCPCTSTGEENLLWLKDKNAYTEESLLIHEIGHCVMDIACPGDVVKRIQDSYHKAMDADLYDKSCYAASNECEYWAEGTQGWFYATIREDVTSGLNTREKLWERNPELAQIFKEVYGETHWRYTDELRHLKETIPDVYVPQSWGV